MELIPGNDDEPVLGRASAPDHGPDFWHEVESEILQPQVVVPGAEVLEPVRTDAPAEVLRPVADPQPTEQLVPVAATRDRIGHWPLLAAAAIFVVVAIAGAVVLRGGSDNNQETVAVAAEATAVPTTDPLDTVEDGTGTAEQTVAETDEPAPAGDTATPMPTVDENWEFPRRLLFTSDDGTRYFAEERPVSTNNCDPWRSRSVLIVASPGGQENVPVGRVYTRIESMTVADGHFLINAWRCDGGQILDGGIIDGDGTMQTTIEHTGSVAARSMFRDLTLVDGGGVMGGAFMEAAVDSDDYVDGAIPVGIPEVVPTPTAPPEPEVIVNVPEDDNLANNARLLATAPDGSVSWFATADFTTACDNPSHSTISVVDGDGMTTPVHSPQYGYSGEISNFTLDVSGTKAAFVVACNGQIELHVATVDGSGRFEASDLAWTGFGATNTAFVQWDQTAVTLNSLQADATPFYVTYDAERARVTDENIPNQAIEDGGRPPGLFPSPAGASADGLFSYWNGTDPDETGGCEGESNTLWVKQQNADWLEAVEGNPDIAIVTALVLEPEYSQIAFADTCEGFGATVYVGTKRSDGVVASPRSLSLTAYVPGFVTDLFWIDEATLQIETNNEVVGGEPATLIYSLRADSITLVR